MHRSTELPLGHCLRQVRDRTAEFYRVTKRLQLLGYSSAIMQMPQCKTQLIAYGHGYRLYLECDGTTLPEFRWRRLILGSQPDDMPDKTSWLDMKEHILSRALYFKEQADHGTYRKRV